jgi:hypothetical protein
MRKAFVRVAESFIPLMPVEAMRAETRSLEEPLPTISDIGT